MFNEKLLRAEQITTNYAPNAFLVNRYSIGFVKFVLIVKFFSTFMREPSLKKNFMELLICQIIGIIVSFASASYRRI